MTLVEPRVDEHAGDWRDRLRHTRTRTRVVAAVVAVLLAAGAVVGAVWWHVSASYDPLSTVGWYGPRPDRPSHVRWTQFGNAHRLVGPAGTQQEFEFGLINDGSHPLALTGIDMLPWDGPGPDPVSGLAWAPYRRGITGGLINGRPSQSQPFPAHLSAHGIVKIRFTVTKPDCPPSNDTELGVAVTMRVHWEAMVSSHTTVISPGGDDYHVDLCGP